MLIFLLSIIDDDKRDKIEQIYDKYHIEMYKIAKHKLRGRPNAHFEAEEALQNAFIKIIQHFDSIRFEEGEKSLHAYFLTIVTNEAINILNNHTEHIGIYEIEETLSSEDDFIEQLCLKSDYDKVVQAIIELDDRYSILLQLKFVEQLTVEEIAEHLNMKVKTVYTNLSRGKNQLIRILKERSITHEGAE